MNALIYNYYMHKYNNYNDEIEVGGDSVSAGSSNDLVDTRHGGSWTVGSAAAGVSALVPTAGPAASARRPDRLVAPRADCRRPSAGMAAASPAPSLADWRVASCL